MELADGDLTLRPFGPDDEAAVPAMLREPEVARWWPTPDFVRESGWVVVVAGEPAGWLEYHEEDYAWYPSVAMDIALTSSLHGRGYGRRALALAIDHFVAKGHHRFTLDPNAANERAIRCYRSLGFEPVGVMRAYERNPAGGFNDALLLELIVPEAIERDALGSLARKPVSAERQALLVLQHAGCEPPGVYEDVLRERCVAFERVVLDEAPSLPDWRGFAAIVAMGGAMGADEEDAHPWLAAEKRLIAEAVAAGTPYWGVCLGAQLLAATLGAEVRPGEAPELGVMEVELTEEARADPVFAAAPARFSSLQWHGDTYELPVGAVRLARSAGYEQQAFAVGRAYGLQFHLEVDGALAAEWMQVPEYVAELEQLDGSGAPARMLAEVRAAERETVPLARELFSRWLVEVVRLRGEPGEESA